jgi:hypothetical protein
MFTTGRLPYIKPSLKLEGVLTANAAGTNGLNVPSEARNFGKTLRTIEMRKKKQT